MKFSEQIKNDKSGRLFISPLFMKLNKNLYHETIKRK